MKNFKPLLGNLSLPLISILIVFGYYFYLQAAVSPKLQFTGDAVLQLENILSRDLLIAQDSSCESVSVSGKNFTAVNIPQGSSFILKTAAYNPTLSIAAINAPVSLSFSSDDFYLGKIASFALSSSDPDARASIVWTVPGSSIRYGVKANGVDYANLDSNSQSQINFIYSESLAVVRTFTLENYRGGAAFVPPAKPDTSQTQITSSEDDRAALENVPDNVYQIAISRTPDFKDAFWQDFDPDKFKTIGNTDETLYVKFRTRQGAVSDVIVYELEKAAIRDIVLNEGDIVKTVDNPDVYIIKYKNGKRFRRLVLSPSVFNSYRHLRWENIKTVSRAQLDSFIISGLVYVQGSASIYELIPEGDVGKRRTVAAEEEYDQDSVYEINETDRDSYEE